MCCFEQTHPLAPVYDPAHIVTASAMASDVI
jgi:hypothetical protein